MKRHWAHNSAIKMSATGLMGGKENGGLLFTTLLVGIALGIGGTLLVQHIRRKKKQ